VRARHGRKIAASFHLNRRAGENAVGHVLHRLSSPPHPGRLGGGDHRRGHCGQHLLRQRFQKNAIKDTAYECGVPSDGSTHTRFSVKFYVTAMLFILFDIEVVFLIPWTFVYRDFLAENIAILSPMLFFLGVLVLGLFYEVKKGALDWEK